MGWSRLVSILLVVYVLALPLFARLSDRSPCVCDTLRWSSANGVVVTVLEHLTARAYWWTGGCVLYHEGPVLGYESARCLAPSILT